MYVLVHSPLVGPLSWQRFVEELARRGIEATIPEVSDHPSSTAPYWEQHARSVARSLRRIPPDEPMTLAAHSGAGPLLPAVVQALGRPVQACLFVDAGLPGDGASRLDGIRRESPEWAAELEAHLRSGGRFPEWTEDDLRDVIPVDGLREGILAEVRPRPLAFFTEPIP